MAEYINTPTTDVGENVLGADALDSNQSGIDTPVMEGGATETFPNLDSAPFVSAGPIGNRTRLETVTHREHRRLVFRAEHTCGEPACGNVYSDGYLLAEHARLTRHKPFRCECGVPHSFRSGLDDHVSSLKREAQKNIVHVQAASEKTHTCAVKGCHRVFSNGSKLEEHAKLNGHKAFHCVCSRGFSKLCSLSRHIDESRKDGTGKYTCPLKTSYYGHVPERNCPCSFKRLNHLEQHLLAGNGKGSRGHGKTAQEAKTILLPFRKRKQAAKKLGVAGELSISVGTPHDEPMSHDEGHSTTPDSSTSENPAGQKAFLAVTLGAVSSTQDTATTLSTAGPTWGSSGFDMSPFSFNTVPSTDGEMLSMTSVSSMQGLQMSAEVGRQGLCGFTTNEYVSPQSVYAPSTDAYSNSYTMLGASGLAMNSVAASGIPFGQAPFGPVGMQYNPSPMVPGVGTPINHIATPAVYPPMHPMGFQPGTLTYGQMGCPTADQLPMRDISQYQAVIPGTFGRSNLASTSVNSGAYAQLSDDVMGESLYGSSTAMQQASMIHDSFFEFDLAGDMDAGAAFGGSMP